MGEFREPLALNIEGNPEPSPPEFCGGKVQRLSAYHLMPIGNGDEIVQASR